MSIVASPISAHAKVVHNLKEKARGVLGKGPDIRGTKLFTIDTFKMILGLDHSDHGNLVAATLAFGAFVFVQLFVREKCAVSQK